MVEGWEKANAVLALHAHHRILRLTMEKVDAPSVSILKGIERWRERQKE